MYLLWLATVLLAVVGSLSWQRRRRVVQEAWRQASGEMGSIESGSRFTPSLQLHGLWEGFQVQVESDFRSVAFRDSHRRDKVLTSDDEFDVRVHAWGDEAQALALLGPEIRERVLKAAEEMDVTLEDGVLRCETSTLADHAEPLVGLVRGVVDLASSMTLEDDMIPRRLAENIASSGSGRAARLRSLAVLQTHFPDLDITLRTDRSLLQSENLYLRLAAAKHLQSPGRPGCANSRLNEVPPFSRG